MVHVAQQRQMFPWLQNDVIFKMSSLKKVYDESLHILHKFTKDVITQKRVQFAESDASNEVKPKGRVAFLDLLMKAELPDGSKLNDEDIQEEVDTFMFEGHDTTACAITWSLYLLGKNPKVGIHYSRSQFLCQRLRYQSTTIHFLSRSWKRCLLNKKKYLKMTLIKMSLWITLAR